MNKPKTNQHLRRKISALAVIAGLAVGVLFALPKAQADQPVPVSGTWSACGYILPDTVHQAGHNVTLNAYQDQICLGDMVGTLSVTPDNPEFDVLHFAKDGVTLLFGTFHGSGTFTGSVLGRTASPAAVFTYQGQLAPDGSGDATYTFDDPVAGIHGEFTMLGNPPEPPAPGQPCDETCNNTSCYVGYGIGTYSGQFQLTP